MRENVLVTGASGGIGRAIALAFGARDCKVVLHYNSNRESVIGTAGLIADRGGSAEVFQADLTVESQVEQIFTEGEKAFGPVTVLVNNAGISWQGLFTDMTLSDWQRVMDVNLTSMFLCCRRALGPMIRRKAGCIINISSMWGQQGAACEAAYSASKAAVIGLTQALAREEGPSGIRVNCIAPGVIDTPMNGRLSPEEVAKAAVFLWENSFITGQTLGVNGGFVM